MTVYDITKVALVQRIIVLEIGHPVKVIESGYDKYQDKEVMSVEPYIEHQLDINGDLTVQAKLEVYING